MHKQIYLNLPVADLAKSKDFYQALGYPLNPQFTGEGTACVVISDTISVMLMAFPHLFPPASNQWKPDVARDPGQVGWRISVRRTGTQRQCGQRCQQMPAHAHQVANATMGSTRAALRAGM